MRKQTLTLLSVILLSGLVFDKGVHAADSSSALLPLPIELVLNEQLTPVYDSIDGQQLYSAAPQVVKVDGAESGWDRKLIQNHEAIWFEIKTPDGERWVHLQTPEFREDYYQHILLTNKESFYNDQHPGARSAGSISPQLLRVLYAEDGKYLVQTWLGYRWIHPLPPSLTIYKRMPRTAQACRLNYRRSHRCSIHQTPAAIWQAGLPRSGSHRKSYGTAGTMWILGMAPLGKPESGVSCRLTQRRDDGNVRQNGGCLRTSE